MKRLLALGLLLIAPVLAPAAEPAADEAIFVEGSLYSAVLHTGRQAWRLLPADGPSLVLKVRPACQAGQPPPRGLWLLTRDAEGRPAEAPQLVEQEQLRLADLWTFQRKEIEALDLKPGEDDELENEKRVLQNVTRLSEHADAAFTALYDAPDSALSQARMAQRRVEEYPRQWK